MSDKSLQMCHCGWSKVTTYQGLRIHQEKNGCTPKGASVPEPRIIFNTYMPKFTYTLPPFGLDGPFSMMPNLKTEEFDRFDDSALQLESDAFMNPQDFQTGLYSLCFPNQATAEAAPVQMFDAGTDSKQGPALGQTQGLFNGFSGQKILSKQPNSATFGSAVKMENKPLFGTAQVPLQSSDNTNKTRSALDSLIGSQTYFPMSAPQSFSDKTPASNTHVAVKEKENNPLFQSPQEFSFSGVQQANSTRANSGATVKEENVPLFGATQAQFNFSGNGHKVLRGYDWSSGAQQSPSKPLESVNTSSNTEAQSQFNSNKTQGGYDWSSGAQQSVSKPECLKPQQTAANTEVTAREENQPFFRQSTFNFSSNKALGGYDWSSGAQQSTSTPESLKPQQTAANTQMTVKEENKPLFQGPQQLCQTNANPSSLFKELIISDVAQQATSTRPRPAEATSNRENKPLFEPPQQTFQSSNNGNKTERASHLTPGTQQFASVPVSQSPNTKPTSTASDVTFKGFESQQQLHQFSFSQTQPGVVFSAGAQQPPVTQPGPKTYETPAKEETKTVSKTPLPAGAQQPVPMPVSQSSPVTPEAAGKQNKSFFETPQHLHQSATDGNKTRRALDFSTGAEQAQMLLSIPTTTSQETRVQPKEDNHKKEKEVEAEKLLQLHRNKIRAEIQHKIRSREQKLAEVRSFVKACKGSLDAEWLEIDSVFSDVIRVVEEARQKALQPLENRREKLKRDAHNLIKRLQEDIKKLEKAMDEVDDAADLDVASVIKLQSRDSCINTSFSFGTLRTTISTLTEQIQQELEKLSAVELKRIPTFAVDVRLDPTTAHQWLIVSKDAKKVQDGGQSQQLPIAPGRFDMFGSILGVNKFTSGKSYWEVEVGNKGGWDLGVAAGKANRKGTLTLNPDTGYWAIVHYEEDKYAALTAPPVCLELKEKPQKVGVFVDYGEGLVSFYDVTAQRHIHSFTKCLFNDEIFPYFSPHLKKNGKNSEPLVISPVKN